MSGALLFFKHSALALVILLHIPHAIANPHADKGNEITSAFEALAFSGIALGIALTDNKTKTKSDIRLLNRELKNEKNTQH